MPPFQQHSRVNVQDLKAQMVKRIGPERANQYFSHFKGYMSLRFSKTELDKLVVMTIGKENIGLHNEIIRAILTNAIKSETPPQPPPLVQDTSKPVKGVRRKPLLQFAIANDASRKSPGASTPPVWSNGTICGESPRKQGGVCLDQTINKDKGKVSSRQTDGTNCVVDTHRPFENVPGAAEQSEVNRNDESVHLRKRPRIIIPSSPEMAMSKSGVDQLSSSRIADFRHEEVHQQWERGLVRTPLGTPFNSNNMSLAAKLPSFRLTGFPSLQVRDAEQEFGNSNNLPSAEIVQRHMEHIAASEGLEGVSDKCVEILCQGVDTFLKGLIGSCIDLVKSRSLPQKASQSERHVGGCAANGSNCVELCSSGAQKEFMGEDLYQPPISFLDFMAAMDSNPQQLGPEWPLQLERLRLYRLD